MELECCHARLLATQRQFLPDWKDEWNSYEVHEGDDPEPLGPVYSQLIDKVLAN